MKKKYHSLESKQRKFGYIFTLPFIIGALFFIIVPVGLSILFSFGKITLNATGYDYQFVGIENFRYLLRVDATYLRTLTDTIRTTFLNVPVVLVFSFFIASLLNQEFRGRSVARAILFLPLITSSAAVVSLMSRVPAGGLVAAGANTVETIDYASAFASFLQQFKVSNTITNLLVSTVNNIGTVLTMSAIPIVIFLVGLQSISPSLYEASYVEGATKWEVFWKISLPMISPLILVVILYCVVDSFTSADNAIMMRAHDASFVNFNFGLGAAMNWGYLLLVLGLMAIIYVVVNRFVFYQN